jgi:hypothetical protein
MGDGAETLRVELCAGLVGLTVWLRLWPFSFGPCQRGEHAAENGNGSEVLHGRGANQLTIPSQPAPGKALLQSVIQSPLVLA